MPLRILDHRHYFLLSPRLTRIVQIGEKFSKFPISALCKPFWIGMVGRVFNACGKRSPDFTASKEVMSPTPGFWRVKNSRLSPKQV